MTDCVLNAMALPSSTMCMSLMKIAILDSSNVMPVAPTAIMMRPQFGSRPYTAVLTREEETMERAACNASSLECAPLTSAVMRCCAPSPSRASDLARFRQTCSSASWNRPAFRTSSAVSSPAPDAPFAKSATVSLVLWSPSTSIWLNVRLTECESDDCNSDCSTFASVVMNASIVAMLGCIMPAPFVQPPTVTVCPPTSSCTAYSL